jgi:hypothetical protein
MTEVERSFLGELGVVDDFEGGATAGVVRDSVRGSSGALTSLESLPIDLIPLDEDVLSLELAGGSAMTAFEGDAGAGRDKVSTVPSAACMRHSDVEGCEADVADLVAQSLMKLQFLNRDATTSGEKELKGAIPRVQGLGPLATAVIDRMMTLRMEEERIEAQADDDTEEQDQYESDLPMDATRSMDEVVSDGEDVEIRASPSRRKDDEISGESIVSSIDALLVIDRKIDLVTPMLTPLTYEGKPLRRYG